MASMKIGEDWQANKSLVERNKIMLDRQLYTDVNFVFEEKTSKNPKTRVLGAHKYMLISSSAVFCSMLTGDLAKEGDILIEDVEYEIFAAMLRCIYCEELNLTGETVMQMMYASKKYIIPAITTRCSTFLEQNLTPENVCTVLDQALIFHEEKLVEKCLTVVNQNTAEVFETQAFMVLSYTALDNLLQLQELSVQEIDVFKACIKWARNNIQSDTGEEIREKLGDLLYKIRFPVMSGEEFSLQVSPVGVLSHVEQIACFRYICSAQGKENLPFRAQMRVIIQKAQVCGLERPYEIIYEGRDDELPDQMLNMKITSSANGRPSDEVCKSISGLRILCKEGDLISVTISRLRGVSNQGTLCQIDKHPVKSVMMEDGMIFADIYFPKGQTVDLRVGKRYCFEVNLFHDYRSAEKNFQQYVIVRRIKFVHSDFVATSTCGFSEEKTLIVGILVKED